LIHEITRVGRGVVFHFDYFGGRAYRLPEQYAKAVSDADIRDVNRYKILYAVVKRERVWYGMGQFFGVNKWYETYCVFLSAPLHHAL